MLMMTLIGWKLYLKGPRTEVYLETCQISETERFERIVNG